MNAQQTTQKKKEKKTLEIGYTYVDEEKALLTVAEIRKRIKAIMKWHIGKANAISASELFFSVLNISPQSMSVFERGYWWNIIKLIMRQMRKDNDLFVIIGNGKSIYVLQTKEEAQMFKDRTDRHINSLNNLKRNADDWVNDKKWEKI